MSPPSDGGVSLELSVERLKAQGAHRPLFSRAEREEDKPGKAA
jgi:hypothetical protein